MASTGFGPRPVKNHAASATSAIIAGTANSSTFGDGVDGAVDGGGRVLCDQRDVAGRRPDLPLGLLVVGL